MSIRPVKRLIKSKRRRKVQRPFAEGVWMGIPRTLIVLLLDDFRNDVRRIIWRGFLGIRTRIETITMCWRNRWSMATAWE